MTKTIFEQIIERKIPAEILYEDHDIICIKDKYPKAPVHILLISKKCIPSIHDLGDNDVHLLGKIFRKAQDLAEDFGISENYRILTNRGPEAGQSVYHLHFHLLGGGRLEPEGV